ncbi:MAG: hypothetical protein LUH04_00890 [Clostridium sp.]|nr:hypothetical protein [Clostridium sp.]
MRKSTKKLLVTTAISMILAAGTAITSYAGEWNQTGYGWWYDNGNGSYTANDWQYIDNAWYYFNQDGYMRTGWIPVNGRWYYCHTDGAMAHDTWVDGKYYVGSDGAMYTNTTTPDGYKVDGNGLYVSGASSKGNASKSKTNYTYAELKDELGVYPNVLALWTLEMGCTETFEKNANNIVSGGVDYSQPFEFTDMQYAFFLDLYQWALRGDNGWRNPNFIDTRIRRSGEIGHTVDDFNVISCNDADDIIYEYFGVHVDSQENFTMAKGLDLTKKANESGWYINFLGKNSPKYRGKSYYNIAKMDWDNAEIEVHGDKIRIWVDAKDLNIRELKSREDPNIYLELLKSDNLMGARLLEGSVEIRYKGY